MSTDRDAQLLAIGKQCSHPSCLLVDFLPFKCQHCEEAFCQEHFTVSAHHCPKYDESKHNRVAPDCPFCHTPVAVRPNQDPNVRMEEHFNNECSVITGKTGKARTMPICARVNCKKVLFQPIQCNSCKDTFCPAHRFPADHNCTPVALTDAKPGMTNPFANINTKSLNTKASTAGAATIGAIKKTIATVPKPKPTTPAKTDPKVSPGSNPFSKTDRYVNSPAFFPSNHS
ncbi:hypothetical protein BDZ94DRAFT_1257299 [Collybia nuda]|uniref:AN1-type domain-containing protein n=1 Tax=Collybia nuda TaxID=64659 RepID=A0A9P5YAB5_9AGAR|nr:hypothetical protein BDZ94DRAFT_1257299 [Collybia nuda]